MGRSVDGMKLQREKYSGDFIPNNLPELFQGCEKLEKLTPGVNFATSSTLFRCSKDFTTQTCLGIVILTYKASVLQSLVKSGRKCLL
jgi:hypothetical protein